MLLETDMRKAVRSSVFIHRLCSFVLHVVVEDHVHVPIKPRFTLIALKGKGAKCAETSSFSCFYFG